MSNCKSGQVCQVVSKMDECFIVHTPPFGAVVTVRTPLFTPVPTTAGIMAPVFCWQFDGEVRCICCRSIIDELPDEILKPLPPDVDVMNHDAETERAAERDRERVNPVTLKV